MFMQHTHAITRLSVFRCLFFRLIPEYTTSAAIAQMNRLMTPPKNAKIPPMAAGGGPPGPPDAPSEPHNPAVDVVADRQRVQVALVLRRGHPRMRIRALWRVPLRWHSV